MNWIVTLIAILVVAFIVRCLTVLHARVTLLEMRMPDLNHIIDKVYTQTSSPNLRPIAGGKLGKVRQIF